MALQEKHRNTVYNAFVPLLGEEVTEAVLDRKLDDLRAEVMDLRVDLSRQINEVRLDVAHQISTESDKTFHRMLTIAGLGLGIMTGVMTMLFAAFT